MPILALLALLAFSAAPVSAACSDASVNAAVTVCETARIQNGNQTDCHTQLNSLWQACQIENRVAGQIFPPVAPGNPTLTVYYARKTYGLPAWQEPRAELTGLSTMSDDYSERRLGAQFQLWENARSGNTPPATPAAPLAVVGREARPTPSGTSSPQPARQVEPLAARRTDERRPFVPPPVRGGGNLTVSPNSTSVPPAEAVRLRMIGGNNAGAVALADQRLAFRPDDKEMLAMRARARMLAGDRDGAFDDARHLLRLDPTNADARNVFGGRDAIAASADKIGRMQIGLEKTREDDGFGGGGAAERGGGGARDRRFPSGRDVAGASTLAGEAKTLQLNELRRSAQRYDAVGDWPNALREATRLISLDPDNPEGYLLRSRISAKLGQWANVEADARKALELKPDDPAALLMVGRALVAQGKAAEGLAFIDRVVALQPTNALAHYYRGEAYEKLGRKSEAAQEYALAASLDAGLSPLVDEALARLRPGGAVPAPGRAPRAPGKLVFRLIAALLGSVFLLKGLYFLIEQKRKTRFTTRPPMRAEDAEAVPGREPVGGDTLGGNFKIERELARGGMGVVYLATDTVLNRRVAIKRLHRDAHQTEETRRKFLKEAQLAARLKHPNLAQIHSVFGERELHLVFEFVEGQTLDAVLAARGRLSLEETRAVVRQVTRALEHAHGQRVIHRDLKPANVMLGKDGACKVLDFGIAHEARTASSPTMTQAWGTPPYMAPEQEEGFVSPASDLYAVGVLAYELLSGRRPFDGPSQYAAKRGGSWRRLGGEHGLPPEIDRFFERALHPDAAQRFAAAADFREAFEHLSGTPVRL